MFIGAKHHTALHPTGYWTGDDVHTQLDHAITIFEITHPGKQGVFVFDNSTGHSKMPADALLAQGLRKGPCAKLVGKQCETTWVDSGGTSHTQSFLFAAGDTLLFEAKGVRANPLGPDGAVRFRVDDVVESVKPGAGDKKYKPGVVVVSREEDNTYTLRFPSDDVVSGVSVASMQVPVATYKKGPVPAALVGHSKGMQQILLERGVIAETSKLNGKCGTADRKKRKAAKQAVGIGKGESIDVPVHVGWADQVPCCLEFLLSEQADFKEQQNAIQELVLSRGHFCIFLPKFHPELNFIERYWSRVKWYARQFSDGTIKGLKAQADVAMTMSSETCDLALMRRYSRTAWRWVDAYHRGLDGVLANYAVRKSKSHRCVTDKVDREVNQLAVERKEEAAARAAAADHSPPPVLAALADMTTAGALYDCDEE
jgi:hypothetical protein